MNAADIHQKVNVKSFSVLVDNCVNLETFDK
jgi:hypothetical protein